ncbi:hypothetical protein PhCBS80983_g01120 [Powellomyces hirtus]|uniref:Aminotransferase class V domain-containing protein n=1 Tax=Powellomyces hirtus TaxID=109895 RepID=A0A507EDU8_9FUNG|nr:hypothetical protein PhCBS80983_g01120 [Powellomyces hirtus]
MSLYDKVTHWVCLPNEPANGQDGDDDDENNQSTFYVPPPSFAFETSWETYFASQGPPPFGVVMRTLFFPHLTGITPSTTISQPHVDLSPPKRSTVNAHSIIERRPEFSFLAHGSYGATCVPALSALQHWNLLMESSPVGFFYDTLFPYIVRSIRSVSGYVNTEPRNLVLVTNVEVGMESVFRSLDLQAQDTILAFDMTYTAVLYSAQHACDRSGAKLETIHMSSPITRRSGLEDLRMYLDKHDRENEGRRRDEKRRIRLAVFQHITSPTAILLRVKQLIDLCHQWGILVMIDGAHAIGQIPLNLSHLNADFYVTNTHKWFCNPRVARFIWQGTADYSPYLALYMSVKFWDWVGYEKVVERNHALATWCGRLLSRAWGTRLLVEDESMMGSMVTIELPPPPPSSISATKQDTLPITSVSSDTLRNQHGIEIPVFTFRGRQYVRVSLHMYNDERDCVRLGEAVLKGLGYSEDTHPGYALLKGGKSRL